MPTMPVLQKELCWTRKPLIVRRGQGGRRGKRKRKKQHHERSLKRLTKEENAAKKELQQVRRGSSDVAVIRELSSMFHTLIRLHNKAKRVGSTPGSSE